MDLKEKLTLLQHEDEKLKGTASYGKYKMETYSKVDGKWVYIGWYIPTNGFSDAKIKKYKDSIFILIYNEKYVVNDSVKELLEL